MVTWGSILSLHGNWGHYIIITWQLGALYYHNIATGGTILSLHGNLGHYLSLHGNWGHCFLTWQLRALVFIS